MAPDVHGSTWGTLYCGCFVAFLPPDRFKKRERGRRRRGNAFVTDVK